MFYRLNRNKFILILIRFLCLFFVIFIILFIVFEYKARDLVHNLVENELEIHAMNAIDNAVCDVLTNNPVDYNSIIKSDTDENGRVNALYTDTASINMLKSKMSLLINENINNTHKVKVAVPAGAFTGLVLLSSFGPDINVRLTLDGSVNTTIKSEFISAGINQTMHRVYMEVEANVSLTCPIISYETEFTSEYELCQTIIVGNTPELFAALK